MIVISVSKSLSGTYKALTPPPLVLWGGATDLIMIKDSNCMSLTKEHSVVYALITYHSSIAWIWSPAHVLKAGSSVWCHWLVNKPSGGGASQKEGKVMFPRKRYWDSGPFPSLSKATVKWRVFLCHGLCHNVLCHDSPKQRAKEPWTSAVQLSLWASDWVTVTQGEDMAIHKSCLKVKLPQQPHRLDSWGHIHWATAAHVGRNLFI